MQEVDLENMIARYPEIIEPNLTLLARQCAIYGKRPDLLFRDGRGCKLVVEVKIGSLCRADIGQLSEYCAYLFKLDGVRPRGMLVGTWVPDEIRGAAGFNSFECRSLTLDDLEKIAFERGDEDMLDSVRGRGSSGTVARTEWPSAAAEERDCRRTPPAAVSSSARGRPPSGALLSKPSIDHMLRSVLANVTKGTVLSAHEINSAVLDAFPGTPKGSILISDRCYNITNRGLSANHDFRIFEFMGRGAYRYLGEGYPYSGYVTWRNERCGEWTNGVLKKWDNWPARGPLQAVEAADSLK